jgi:hypothetical protein
MLLDMILKQGQVSATPPIDRLLHITDHEAAIPLVKTVCKQRQKVFPLKS